MRTRVRRHWWVGVLVVFFGVGGAVYATNPSVHPRPQPSPTAASSPATGLDACAGTFCVTNSQVTQGSLQQTICRPGWTATIRPPVSFTSPLKVQQLAALGFPDQNPSDYEEDHRLPLELGGAPADPHNLTPEPHTSSGAKDAAENAARASVCSGQKTLTQAQADFVAEWLGPWPAYKK